jgi:uncharacterized membrane protein (UPF0127 family)
MRVRNASRGSVLGEALRCADTFALRMKGLIGTDGLAEGEGLWISPCTGIHSFGMRFVFDAVFLGPDREVVGLYERFRRNRISRIFWNARGVLELPAGTIERTGTEVGDEIRFEE